MILTGKLRASLVKGAYDITEDWLDDYAHEPPTRGRVPRVLQATPPRKHLVIPDTQVREGVPLEHLTWIGKYIADKRPDVLVHIGDHWDMESLSLYDKGKRSYEGRRYKKDVAVGNLGMEMLVSEFQTIEDYFPEMHFFEGNHERRITRATELDPMLEGTIGLGDLEIESYGWNFHPFLEIAKIDGVSYSHYFVGGVMGRPVSSAAALLKRVGGSAVMGHVQNTEIAVHPQTQQMAIFAGTAYQHDEPYLTAQGNNQRRQIWMLHEVRDGIFDPMMVSLNFLKGRYA